MKLLVISTQGLTTPPLGPDGIGTYGGLEQVVWCHAKGLAELGEDVTLIACRGSKAPPGVKLIELCEKEFANEELAYHMYKSQLYEYDVVLDHSWQKWSYLDGDYLPVIGTMHSPLPFRTAPPKKYPMLCGVSNEHSIYASKHLGIPIRTTWNSVDIKQYPFSKKKGDYFLTINRITPEKGIDIFVDWVGRAKVKGMVVGDDKLLARDQPYIAQVKANCIKYGVDYKGLVSHPDKVNAIQECKAVVLLPQSPNYLEVFGLAAVEALACGKPVICTPNCGLKDIIENEKTGFFVETYEQFLGAINAVDSISPKDCRKRAEEFSIETISVKYRDMIKKVASGCRW